MKNITFALDEKTLEAGRTYAELHQTTLNALVRDLLARVVLPDRQASVAEMFRLMDAYSGHSGGRSGTREEIYAR